MRCSIEESTGSALRDLRNEPKPGVMVVLGGAMMASSAIYCRNAPDAQSIFTADTAL